MENYNQKFFIFILKRIPQYLNWSNFHHLGGLCLREKLSKILQGLCYRIYSAEGYLGIFFPYSFRFKHYHFKIRVRYEQIHINS